MVFVWYKYCRVLLGIIYLILFLFWQVLKQILDPVPLQKKNIRFVYATYPISMHFRIFYFVNFCSQIADNTVCIIIYCDQWIGDLKPTNYVLKRRF